ncbi:hypothetical protein LCGC14_1576630 [marine sediment metagenome]|uniref:Uncharacterized protein n=1 Tax=marine sediment metagenome TaxID=412755 RepID=A0A0F9J4A0_9ZZZZ
MHGQATGNIGTEVTTIKGLANRAQELNVQLERVRVSLQELAQRLNGTEPAPSSDIEQPDYPGDLGELESYITLSESLATQINEIIALLKRL